MGCRLLKTHNVAPAEGYVHTATLNYTIASLQRRSFFARSVRPFRLSLAVPRGINGMLPLCSVSHSRQFPK